MTPMHRELAEFVRGAFERHADPAKAGPMAAYMKTTTPFLGIQKPDRASVLRVVKQRFRPSSRDAYDAGIQALWALPHREEKYAAVDYALLWPDHIRAESLPLYERLVREGAWWDLVDSVAANLVGRTLLRERETVRPVMDRWIADHNLWIRRAALLAHLRHKTDTDWEQLSRHCLRCAGETEFFIRKAIGWALREYSKTNPEAVRVFLQRKRESLSALSYREGARHLIRAGMEL